jgi:hypothetical protein
MSVCEALHKWVNSSPAFHFPFDASRIPPNGIYVLLEQGEVAHGAKRIVRVGTHTGCNQLPPRLRQHFLIENKDRSIFRKNIGRAIMNRDIREHFSFVVIPVEEKAERLGLESKMISTVSLCDECKPTAQWLGLCSPKQKIRESGLWLVNELYKEPLSTRDLERLSA